MVIKLIELDPSRWRKVGKEYVPFPEQEPVDAQDLEEFACVDMFAELEEQVQREYARQDYGREPMFTANGHQFFSGNHAHRLWKHLNAPEE